MSEFFRYHEHVSIAMSVLCVIAILFQGMNLVYLLHRFHFKTRAVRVVLEGVILGVTFLLLKRQAYMMNSLQTGYYIENTCSISFLTGMIIIAILAGIETKKSNNKTIFLGVLPLFILLPIQGRPVFSFYCGWIAAAWILIRAVYHCIRQHKKINTELTYYSIKSAIEQLPTALLFMEADGRIFLMNSCMEQMMHEMDGHIDQNGEHFWERFMVQMHPCKSCKRLQAEGLSLYECSDHQVWHFRRHNIQIGKRIFGQITAVNVTKQWELLQELKQQKDRWEEHGSRLKQLLDELEEICFQEEILRLKSHFHDTIGQNVAVLHRSIREKEKNFTYLQEVDQYLEKMLQMEDSFQLETKMESLIKTMHQIGVEIIIKGSFPSEEQLQQLWYEIIREGCTNSVRHGMASKIWIQLACREGKYQLQIQDNGSIRYKKEKKLSGLKDIQTKLAQNRGSLSVTYTPRFVLQAEAEEIMYDTSTSCR